MTGTDLIQEGNALISEGHARVAEGIALIMQEVGEGEHAAAGFASSG